MLLARGSTHPSLGFTLPWLIAVPLGFAAAFAALTLRPRVRDEGGWRAVVRHGGLEAVHMLRQLASQEAKHGGAFFGTTLYWVGDVGCLWASLRVFHESPDLAGLVIGMRLGTRHAAHAAARRCGDGRGARLLRAGGTGIPLAKAVLAVCAYRIFNLWLPLVPAAIGRRHLKRWRDVAARTG